MASMKKTPASGEVSDEEFEGEFEEELEEEFEEEFEEEMEETLENDEYEDIEEEEVEEEEEEEEMVDEVVEKEETVDKSLEKGEAVEELGEEDEGEEEEELYEEVEEEADEEEEEMVDQVFEKEETVDKSSNKGEAVEELGEEEGAEEEELYEEEEEEVEDDEEEEEEKEEEEEEEEEKEEEEEEEETVDQVFEKEEAAEDLGVDEKGVNEVGEEQVKKEMLEVQEVKKEEEFLQRFVGEEENLASKGTAPPPIMSNLPFLQSISEMEKFHGALSKFLDQWKSLNGSLDSISAAIDAHSQRPAPMINQEKEKVDLSEIEIICNNNNGKYLRKYVENSLYDVARLRSEVTEAFRCSVRCPGRLVLQAIGRFYLQMRSCYKDLNLVTYRRASILLLEFLVLSGRINEEASMKKETDAAAIVWMNRIISEDIETATAVDSLGLVLFLACYGIPQEFSLKNLSLLLRKSNLKKKGDVFRRSRILVEKIPGIIKALIKDEMYVEAADLSCGFGLTDTFPPLPLLSSSTLKAIEVGKMDRQKCMDSPHLIKESDKRQLNILKSVAKCIEDHKLGAQTLGSINIYKKIMQLEKFQATEGWTPHARTLKRKVEHLEPYSLPERRSKEPFRSSSETPEEENEHRNPRQPQHSDSRQDNSSLPRGWDRKNYENSAGYRSLGVEYSSAQNVCQPQAPAYGNEGGRERRDLYKFADTVIEHESKRGKSNRSSNPSSGSSMFGRR